MTPLTVLWLPIIVSSVIIFVASSIIHMMIGWHKRDYPRLEKEAELLDAVRPLAIPPGDYMVPSARDGKEMRSPEFIEKMNRGPVMIMTVRPAGMPSMAPYFVQWFLYSVVVGIFAAYIAGRALPPGADYLQVFRFVGATAFVGYALALWQMSIWYHRNWGTTILSTVDGLIYALLTAGTFGWLWPR